MFGRKQFVIIIIVIASLSPFVFFSSSLKPWLDRGRSVTIVQEFIYPFQYVWHATTSKIQKNWTRYIGLVDTRAENEKLQQEVNRLKTELIDYNSKIQEVARLKELLLFKGNSEKNLVYAEVVSIGHSAPFRSMRIDKGRLENIDIGMPVISPQGVVGRVIRTGLKFSDVLLIDDNNFHIDVILERTRQRGIIQGILNNQCLLEFNKRIDIKIGDSLITSGAVGGFPKGIPVGKISKISFKSDNVTQTIFVEPWVEIDKLEEVMVIKNSDLEVNEIRDTAGENWLDKATEKFGGS